MRDHLTTIQDLKDLTQRFKKERNWGANHTPKNLAVSIAIEGAELMEHFQWEDVIRPDSRLEIKQELADVVIYCLFFAQASRIDLAKAIEEKMAHNARKYPVELFKGEGGTNEDYYRIKRGYRQKQHV